MKKSLLIIVLALQSIFLTGMTAWNELHLRSGTEILLETAPVDPRDLLRGDFVILNYKISTIDGALWDVPISELRGGQKVYVLLELRGEFHEVVRASTKRPTAEQNQVTMQGVFIPDRNAGSALIHYGLERYYVAEGTGNPRGKLTALVSVSKRGKPLIREVYVDGVPYKEAARAGF